MYIEMLRNWLLPAESKCGQKHALNRPNYTESTRKCVDAQNRSIPNVFSPQLDKKSGSYCSSYASSSSSASSSPPAFPNLIHHHYPDLHFYATVYPQPSIISVFSLSCTPPVLPSALAPLIAPLILESIDPALLPNLMSLIRSVVPLMMGMNMCRRSVIFAQN
jgi:hypothetical protein